ncbi:MAG: response regulator [bacterium]
MQKKRVLIIEDDVAFAELAKLALRNSNYQIDVADDGCSALEMLSKRKYDLVISDYRLPNIHGIDVLKAAKRHNPNCETVLMSAASPEMMESSLKDLNLSGFLQKPFLPAKLRDLVVNGFNKIIAGVVRV